MKEKRCLALAVLGAVAVSSAIYPVAEAAETASTDEYALEDVVVTAQRVEKSDMDVPAATTVITAEQIARAGYRNAYEAIERQIGSANTGMGGAGQDFGTSSSRISLRGYDRGTLLLVNGAPLNLNNYANPASIPSSMIERIEIVKGAASTLYGGEAMGGVVNIILKKPSGKAQGSAAVTFGNYDRKTEVTYGNDQVLFDISREWTKNISHSSAFGADKLSWTDYWTGKGQVNRLAMTAKLTDELSLNYDYMESTIRHGGPKYKLNGSALKYSSYLDYRYNEYRHTANLTYAGKENGVKAVLGWNYRRIDAWDNVKHAELGSNSTFDGEILDVQKTWNRKKDVIVGGYAWRREAAENLTGRSADRISNAIYAAYTHPFNDRFSMTLGLRGEFIDDAQKNQNVCLPQIQTNYRINKTAAWYVNIGRAFQMPELDDAISYRINDTSAVRPEQGWNYETGLKLRRGNDIWKLAVYHMDMTDKLGWKKRADNTYYTVNKGDFRNTGFELEYTHPFNEVWNLHAAGSISNPEVKDPTDGNTWKQDAARLQAGIGVEYKKAKWDGSLDFSYLGNREYYSPTYLGSASGAAQDVPSNVLLNLNIGYQCGKADRVILGIYNLLDRDIYTSKYGNLDLPRNYRLTFTHAF